MTAPPVVLCLGTRPEIVKMAPVLRALARRGTPHAVVHTNQHYSPEMDRVFFEELELRPAEVNLGVGSGSHGAQTGLMLQRIEAALVELKPCVVLVEGDTNSVLAGALAAAKLRVPVGHVEAGLRSGDRTMPEELNRIVTDHLATWCYAPTPGAADNLRRAGIAEAAIVVTGNTVVDAALENAPLADRRPVLTRLGLTRERFLVLTIHRAETTDLRSHLESVLGALEDVAAETSLPMLWPVHPRAAKQLETFGLAPRLHAIPRMQMTPPLSYLDFLCLERAAACLLTDSGGVQEEACVFGVPCVTLRDNTERPETLAVGANVLAGRERGRIVAAVRKMLAGPRGAGAWPNPFGDGHAGERTVEHLVRALGAA